VSCRSLRLQSQSLALAEAAIHTLSELILLAALDAKVSIAQGRGICKVRDWSRKPTLGSCEAKVGLEPILPDTARWVNFCILVDSCPSLTTDPQRFSTGETH